VLGLQRKKIGADGSIVAVEYEETQRDRGFRPGMPRLRDIKKAWTLTDFLEMDEQVKRKGMVLPLLHFSLCFL